MSLTTVSWRVDDEAALRLLTEMLEASPGLCERFWDRPHEKRNKSERWLRDLLGLITLREEWAFFMIQFSRYTPAAVFLSDSQSDVETVAEAARVNGNRDNLVERW